MVEVWAFVDYVFGSIFYQKRPLMSTNREVIYPLPIIFGTERRNNKTTKNSLTYTWLQIKYILSLKSDEFSIKMKTVRQYLWLSSTLTNLHPNNCSSSYNSDLFVQFGQISVFKTRYKSKNKLFECSNPFLFELIRLSWYAPVKKKSK